jgi:hypothetical protein
MPERHDALRVRQLQGFPNVPNIIPGSVKHAMELRDRSEKIASLGDEIQRRAQPIANQTATKILIKKVEHDPPAIATPEIQEKHGYLFGIHIYGTQSATNTFSSCGTLAPRFEMKTSFFPSGENCGKALKPPTCVTCSSALLSRLIA